MNNKLKKIFIAVSIVVLVCLIIVVSVILFYKKHRLEMSYQLEDKNGESKELAIITDEMISMYTEEYHAYRRRDSSKYHNRSGIEGPFEDCDSSYVKTNIRMLTGVYVANAYLGEGKEVSYNINSTVKSGNLKIVITDEDNQILYNIPIDSNENVKFIANKDEIYYVKFVGERAQIEVEITREDT